MTHLVAEALARELAFLNHPLERSVFLAGFKHALETVGWLSHSKPSRGWDGLLKRLHWIEENKK
jgi:hypothetical protein